jgi:L-threonylcarbamoyladenylate synthase
LQYVAAPHPAVFDLLEEADRPTTVIYENALGLPDALVNADGSIAIRIVKDPFCRHLVRRLRAPLVSTSANISGEASPGHFGEISQEIIDRVDHVVKWRQEERVKGKASRIVKMDSNGDVSVIRE